MEFKLKEGWSDYLIAGFCIGILFSVLTFIQLFQTQVNISINLETILLLLAVVVFSVFSFIMGCRVKKK